MPMRASTAAKADLEPRFHYGICLGVLLGAQESTVGAAGGTVKARSPRGAL